MHLALEIWGNMCLLPRWGIWPLHTSQFLRPHSWLPQQIISHSTEDKGFTKRSFRQEVTIYLRATGTKLCPVKALLAYIEIRGNNQGALFLFSNKQLLTRAQFVKHLSWPFPKQESVQTCASHSFRIGAAMVAHIKGIEDSIIMTLGRWKNNSYQTRALSRASPPKHIRI